MSKRRTGFITKPPTKEGDLAFGGQSKIERYGWKSLDGGPGQMLWIEKEKLLVDHAYQRSEVSEPKVLRIASEWSWMACGVILVARRDGRLYVYAGQHRVLAAMRRSDITKMPCMVFDVVEAKQEAIAFLREGANRKPLTAADKFKAAVMAEDEASVFVSQLIESAGRVASTTTGPGTVRCVALLQHHAKNNSDDLKRLWPLVVEVCKGNPLHERILDGLMYIELRMPDGQSLTDRIWSDRLRKIGYEVLLISAARMSAAYSVGGAKIWAQGMLEAINKGLRNRLVIRGQEEASA